MIFIKNLKNEQPKEPWQVRVDRASILGNPFEMKNYSEEERDRVCDLYKEYFNKMLRPIKSIADFNEMNKRISFTIKLNQLCTIYKKYGKLELFCWCAPKRCHAETIRDYILNQVK